MSDYYGYIYVTQDQLTNKVYVGQKRGTVERTNSYLGSGNIIRNIIKKRGSYFLKKVILGYCYSREEIDAVEEECIAFFDATNKLYGYNIRKSSKFGSEKLSQGQLKRYEDKNEHIKTSEAVKLYCDLHPERAEKHSNFLIELYKDPLEREKQSIAQIESFKNNPERGEVISKRMKKYFEDEINLCWNSAILENYHRGHPDAAKELGVKQTGKGNPRYIKIDTKEVIRLRLEGCTISKLCEIFKVADHVIYRRINDPEKYI